MGRTGLLYSGVSHKFARERVGDMFAQPAQPRNISFAPVTLSHGEIGREIQRLKIANALLRAIRKLQTRRKHSLRKSIKSQKG